jgi:hypothetical protein
MKLYEIIMTILAIAIFITGIAFGYDKEMARRDYEKALRDGDHEKPIVGCIWQHNCDYYTEKLFD